MIDRIGYLESKTTNPYHNLALEEYLLLHCKETECILYVWQTSNAVVIGKNQNAAEECNFENMEAGQCVLIRRMSKDSTTYYDMGNLNVTFITSKQNYDGNGQLDIIAGALRELGIMVEKTEHNSMAAGGRKICANAFYEKEGRCCHHWTITVNVDMKNMFRYLNVSDDRLRLGIVAARSRIANLTEFDPFITVEQVKDKLFEAFEDAYGCQAEMVHVKENKEFWLLAEKYASWEWNRGE